MDLTINQNIQKAVKKYEKLMMESRRAIYKYEKEFKKKCINCSRYIVVKNIPLESKFIGCTNCYSSIIMRKCVDEFFKADKEVDSYINKEFAQIIFNELINENPYIYNIRNNNFFKFDEVFGADFKKINKDMYFHLVGLVTDDGGLYRIKK